MTFKQPAVWFPAIRAGSGIDIFTERLAAGLRQRGIQAEITWFPLRTEYAPWMVSIPHQPVWANIVHANTWMPLRFLSADLPLVATLHHCVQDNALTPYKTALQALYHNFWVTPMERRVISKANRCVAVSRYTMEQANAVFKDANFEIIPNGVDTTIFKPAATNQPHRPFRLLFIGNWSKRKGVDLLAPIMQHLGAGFELTYLKGLHATRTPSPTTQNMRSVPRLSSAEMIRLYQESDALLFPTRLEGFGLAALEAQACGLPVIATQGSALPEVVSNGKTGLLCPQDDVSAFAAAARKLADNPALWQHMGYAARVHVEAHFRIETMIDHYLSVYREILSR